MADRGINTPLGGDGFGGPVAVALLVGAGFSLWSVFALSTALGVAAVLFIALCIYVLFQLGALEEPQSVWVGILLVLAILGVLLIHPLTIDYQVVPFAWAGWTVIGLFIASLLAGAWLVLSALGRALAMIGAAAAVAAMVVLPPPRGAGADDAEPWHIDLTVLDENGEPLKEAVAQCSTAMVWDSDGPVEFSHLVSQTTDEEGLARFTFREDTRLKVAVCTALKENDSGAIWMAPREEHFARALYPPKSAVLAAPFPGHDYKLTLQLERRQAAQQ